MLFWARLGLIVVTGVGAMHLFGLFERFVKNTSSPRSFHELMVKYHETEAHWLATHKDSPFSNVTHDLADLYLEKEHRYHMEQADFHKRMKASDNG